MSIALLTATLRTMKNVTDEQYTKMTSYVSSRVGDGDLDFGHITRRKTRLELIMISAAVCGVEFCYAAETAFVSPTLLKIGVPVLYMTWIWCLSPLVGFFLVPILGSLSDRCRLQLGRRRPFILLLSTGIILGLILVPNGQDIGVSLGDHFDTGPIDVVEVNTQHTTSADNLVTEDISQPKYSTKYQLNVFSRNIVKVNSSENPYKSELNDQDDQRDTTTALTVISNSMKNMVETISRRVHPFSILFTILGVVVLDFSCDACQSPCRAYMVDVTIPADHGRGLTTFTIMAGFGGAMGYVLGGIDWGSTSVGASLGGHIKVVFTTVLFIYLICMTVTIFSIREVPLDRLGVSEEFMEKKKKTKKGGKKYKRFHNESDEDTEDINVQDKGYGSGWETPRTADATLTPIDQDATENGMNKPMTNDAISVPIPLTGNQCMQQQEPPADPMPSEVSLKTYLMSIVHMPKSLLILCVTNLFCWMSLVCYSLYFTDFVGQAVYGGNPSAPHQSSVHQLYDEGVRMGSFGMAFYSISCSFYSLAIEQLVSRFGRST